MPMMKNTLEDYKRAIQLKYEIEKNGIHSGLLLNPSRAKLRKLCAELFKNNSNADDLKSFAAFFHFDFNPNNSNKLKEQTDKFRPIETFFKGETDLTDIEGVNIAAIVVNFKPRPYLKFSKLGASEKEVNNNNDFESSDVANSNEAYEIIKKSIAIDQQIRTSFPEKKRKSISQKQTVLGIILTVILCGFGYSLLQKKGCMQWQNDHYEAVECETKKDGFVNLYSKVPLDENMLNFRKIEVCDTTTFFKHNKPILWYCKNGKQLEFFNGPGFHPESEKALKPITQYMIDKYVK